MAVITTKIQATDVKTEVGVWELFYGLAEELGIQNLFPKNGDPSYVAVRDGSGNASSFYMERKRDMSRDVLVNEIGKRIPITADQYECALLMGKLRGRIRKVEYERRKKGYVVVMKPADSDEQVYVGTFKAYNKEEAAAAARSAINSDAGELEVIGEIALNARF